MINYVLIETVFDLFIEYELSYDNYMVVGTTDRTYRPPTGEEELVPPIDHCIRTKLVKQKYNGII